MVGVDRGRFTVADGTGATLLAVRARTIHGGIVVGDAVRVTGTGTVDDPARIVRRDERATVLRRSADDADSVERIIVANARQLAIVTAVVNPEPRTGLIDRMVVAAYDAGIEPILVITKTDLADPSTLAAHYEPLDLPVHLVADGIPPDSLRNALHDTETVLAGHSGVGKSTLVNALVPRAERVTGDVNEVTGRGRHTSTSVVALRLPEGGWIIDTPGVRSFGLAHLDADRIVAAFTDLGALAEDCPRGCSHDEPGCALDDAVDPREQARVASLRRLLRNAREAT